MKKSKDTQKVNKPKNTKPVTEVNTIKMFMVVENNVNKVKQVSKAKRLSFQVIDNSYNSNQ